MKPNREHLELLLQGSVAWNAWRLENPKVVPQLQGADLSSVALQDAELTHANLREAKLCKADLQRAYLTRANLYQANLSEADLSEAVCFRTDFSYAQLYKARLNRAKLGDSKLYSAILRDADLGGANLFTANLRNANLGNSKLDYAELSWSDLSQSEAVDASLRHANLTGANLFAANLERADFAQADLSEVNLTSAILIDANLHRVRIGLATFGNNDLSGTRELITVNHWAPSTIGIDTLFKSQGNIPEGFLRGAGVPEDFITFVPSLVGRAIEFYSCFISYSHQDEEFSRRLHSRMRVENLRVWFAPEDMKGGRKLHEEIFRAIQIHDKLLLVLSDDSMKSEWVMTEIRRAKKVEREENRRKLFPIRLVDFETIQKWECFDADSGKDLAAEVREYYIPDFSNWKDHDSFESEFDKLLRDLRATEK